jgi:hypothetical protein
MKFLKIKFVMKKWIWEIWQKNRKIDSWEISRYIIVLLEYSEGTWKMEKG